MRGEKSKCSLEFYVILSVTIENICKQITPAAKFAIQILIRKLPDMNISLLYVTEYSVVARYNRFHYCNRIFKLQVLLSCENIAI